MRLSSGLLLSALLMGCGPSSEDIATNLSSENLTTREDTAKIARNFGSEEVEAALIMSLEDPNSQVRYNALESLIELETIEAVPAADHRCSGSIQGCPIGAHSHRLH